MSNADTRAAAVPTETDIAFAKAIKARRTASDKSDEAPVPAGAPPEASGNNEVAMLKAELAELRKIVMSQNKAPTSARRIGEVADAEMAAEAVDHELMELIVEATPRAKPGPGEELIFAVEDREKIAELRKKVREHTAAVDVARALAGLIPMTHPGLKHLPPEHPVFRVR